MSTSGKYERSLVLDDLGYIVKIYRHEADADAHVAAVDARATRDGRLHDPLRVVTVIDAGILIRHQVGDRFDQGRLSEVL